MDDQEFFLSRATLKRLRKLTPIADIENAVAVSGRGSAWKHTRTGHRVDLDQVFRSGWEANIARIMHCYGIKFEFEPMVFTFPVKRGTKGYTPDFRLVKTGEWLEVKGYFDSKSRIKLKRFKKYFPEEAAGLTLILGSSKESITIAEDLGYPYLLYPRIGAYFKDKITNWEGR